jgi:hypothetical protein
MSKPDSLLLHDDCAESCASAAQLVAQLVVRLANRCTPVSAPCGLSQSQSVAENLATTPQKGSSCLFKIQKSGAWQLCRAAAD